MNNIEDINKIVMENEKLVKFLIRKNFPNLVENKLDDYIQEGFIALIKAAKNYDSSFGVTFSSFASKYIIGTVKRYMYEKDTELKVSRECIRVYRGYLHLTNKGMSKEDIANELGVNINLMQKYINSCSSFVYLDDGFKDDDIHRDIHHCFNINNYNLEDEVLGNISLEEKIKMLKETISERDFNVLIYRLNGKTQREIAEIFGISQVAVSKIIEKTEKIINEL